MAAHKYRIGQTLTFSPGRIGMREAQRTCTIIRLLPVDAAGEPQYRIKCSTEVMERVTRETTLSKD